MDESTPAAPAAPQLPNAGGQYVAQPDGSLTKVGETKPRAPGRARDKRHPDVQTSESTPEE